MDPTTICEEDHKLATVCLITHSGQRDSNSVQNKIVHFKSVFSIGFYFLLSELYILSFYFVSFHLLDDF